MATEQQCRRLLVISGPPGVGKDTVITILTNLSSFERVPSCTTRPPRGGEIDGIDYNFLTTQEFEDRSDLFLDNVTMNGYRYGLPIADVRRTLEQRGDVVVQLIVQSAELLKKQIPSAVLVYLSPPNSSSLEERLRARGDSELEIKARLSEPLLTMFPTGYYDLVLTNQDYNPGEVVNRILQYLDMT